MDRRVWHIQRSEVLFG